MRKSLTYNYFRILFSLLMFMPLMLSAQTLSTQTHAETVADVQLPNLIANPADKSTVQWFNGIAMRWGTSRLTIVNNKGFKVTRNGTDITKDSKFDFVMQTVEYDPDENTSWDDVQLQIEATGIYPMTEEGTYVFTVYAGSVNINVDGQQVANPQVELTYYIGKAGPTAQIPEPTVNPANNSKLDKLENVTLRWNGYNVNHIGDGEGGKLMDITYTVNGGSPRVIDVEYSGAESMAFQGYYPTLSLPINATESGKYVITIPAGAIYIANGNSGSLTLDKDIVLTYDVTLTETPPAVLMTGATVDPRDGTRMDNMGNVMIAWTQYKLAITPEPNKDYVDLPLDGVHIYINDEENTTWIKGMGASLRAVNTKGSNEGGGGTESFEVAEIILCPGDPAFWWKGTVNIVLPEGLVKTTNGAVSPAFDLTYYVGGNDVISPAVFTPEDGAKFLAGEAVVYAEWTGYNVTAINGGITVNTINDEGDVSGSTSISNGQLSIENGKLKIDLTYLRGGNYQMWIHQGAVNLGDNAINADAPYVFTIEGPEPEAPEATDIDPDINLAEGKITISWEGNDIEFTDDFNLSIIDSSTGEQINIPNGAVVVEENNTLVINLGQLGLSDGDYTLSLVEGSVNIDENGVFTYNNKVTYAFTSSGIAVPSEDGYWRVFNLNGVNILNTDDASALKKLQPGIYIVNRKKLVVK